MANTASDTKKLENFAAQYEQKANSFYQIAYYTFLDKGIAEEIVKESFFQGCKELAGKENITQEFFHILVSQCKRRLKDRNLEEDAPTVKNLEANGEFHEILKGLSPKARMVLALFMIEGMDTKDIAKLFSMKHKSMVEYVQKNTDYVQKAMTGGIENGEI